MVSDSPAPNTVHLPLVLNNHHSRRKLGCYQDVCDWDEEPLWWSQLTGAMWSEEGHENQMEPPED